MPRIYVFRRKWKDKDGIDRTAKEFSAEIRFGSRARYLRSTGETEERKAKSAARRIAAEIEAKELPKRGKEVLTLDVMFARWINEVGHELRSGKDIRWQVQTLLRLIGAAREVSEIGTKDVSGFVQDAKQQGAGPVKINRCLERLRGTMNYAAEIWEEPIRVISWKKLMQEVTNEREVYLSPDEARRIMAILPTHIGLAFAFTLYTGCRLDEMETLIWDRVDFGRGAATVITKGRGRKLRTRTVWLSEKAITILHAVRVERSGDRVFDLTNRRRHWERARKAIGREDVTWHDLRGMTATWSRQFAKADMKLISSALGHTDTKVTERYARVVDREIVEMLDKLPDISSAAHRAATQLNPAQHNALTTERNDHENL
jgi:integrase